MQRLRASLQALGGQKPGANPGNLYDAELTRLVEAFQRERRLAVDGVASIATQVMVDSAQASQASGGDDTPTLVTTDPRE